MARYTLARDYLQCDHVWKETIDDDPFRWTFPTKVWQCIRCGIVSKVKPPCDHVWQMVVGVSNGVYKYDPLFSKPIWKCIHCGKEKPYEEVKECEHMWGIPINPSKWKGGKPEWTCAICGAVSKEDPHKEREGKAIMKREICTNCNERIAVYVMTGYEGVWCKRCVEQREARNGTMKKALIEEDTCNRCVHGSVCGSKTSFRDIKLKHPYIKQDACTDFKESLCVGASFTERSDGE